MSTPSQGLRALASIMEAVAPEFSTAAQTALSGIADQLHTAADAEASTETVRLAGPVAGPLLSLFADTMIDSFFNSMRIAPSKPTTTASAA